MLAFWAAMICSAVSMVGSPEGIGWDSSTALNQCCSAAWIEV
jgi:hypothetical protein